MAQPPPITSPYAPDVAEVRAWLERMVAALKLAGDARMTLTA
jgi:hypothetical protein